MPRSGPAVGKHNDEVYASMGSTMQEVMLLRSRGVI
jgi:hypothetical protein